MAGSVLRKGWLLAAPGLIALCSPAKADPIITPLVLSIVTAVGVSASVAPIVATVLTAVITTAIGFGISLLLAPKPPKPPPPENGSFPFQQAVSPRIFAYGRCRIGGYTVLLETAFSYLHHVIALCAHQVHDFIQFYLNDDAVTLVSNYVVPGTDGRYSTSYVSIQSRNGVAPETAYSIPALAGLWTANHRGDGVASLYMMCVSGTGSTYSTAYPYGRPSPSAVMDTALVYDWRDGTQIQSDPTTWKFSRNPAVCIAHQQCFSEFGPKRDFTTSILPVLDKWTTAANVCDEAAALKAGGTEVRYRLGGWSTTEQDSRTVLQALLTSCDGWFVARGDGTIILEAGKYHSPAVTLTDADITGFILQSDVSSEDKINQATAAYTFPDGGYTTVETDTVVDAADQALRPGPPKTARLELPWVQSTGQASRLLHREIYRQKQTTRGKLYLKLSGINACYERYIQISSNALPARLRNVVIENRKATFSLAEQWCQIDFIGSGPSLDSYDPSTDESAAPTLPDKPTTAPLPKPTNVSAVAEEVTDASGANSIYLDVSWDQAFASGALRTDLTYRLHWRLNDAGGGVAGPWTDQSVISPTAGTLRWSTATPNVPAGIILDVEVASVGTLGGFSEWSTTVQVDTSPTSTAPGSPTSFTAVGAVGHATLSCTNPNSSNFSAVRFYRSASGAAFSSATPLGSPIYGAPNGTSTYTDTTAVGTYSYWVVSLNTAGVASAPTGPRSATIT